MGCGMMGHGGMMGPGTTGIMGGGTIGGGIMGGGAMAPPFMMRMIFSLMAENVPGVKAVRDHLVWIDAASGMAISRSSEEPIWAQLS